MTANKTSYVER